MWYRIRKYLFMGIITGYIALGIFATLEHIESKAEVDKLSTQVEDINIETFVQLDRVYDIVEKGNNIKIGEQGQVISIEDEQISKQYRVNNKEISREEVDKEIDTYVHYKKELGEQKRQKRVLIRIVLQLIVVVLWFINMIDREGSKNGNKKQ